MNCNDKAFALAAYRFQGIDSMTKFLTSFIVAVVAILAGCGSGAEGTTSETPVATVPQAPSGIFATPGDLRVTLGWSATAGADSYNLYYSTSASVGPSSGTRISGASSPYTQLGVTNGTTYYYVVTAVNGAGESAASSVVSATPVAAPASSLTLTYAEDPTPVVADFPTSVGRFALPALSAMWPIDRLPAISSPFGPRWKASESRYDWHRGIDIPGNLGDPVYSIADGTVYKVALEGDADAVEGGNTVYIEHTLQTPIVFHGRQVTRFYSSHAHLNAIAPGIVVGATVQKGLQIGTVGQSGTTTFNHDHFEIRLQTTCSLEYQLAHPTSTCSQYGFDPHVNPVQFLFPDHQAAPEVTAITLSGAVLKVTVAAPAPAADFDYVAVVLKDGLGQQIYAKSTGFNGREGFDPSSVSSLDVQSQGGVTYLPAEFSSGTQTYGMEFAFDLSALGSAPSTGRLLVQDVWGNSRTISLTFN